jgi:hypothetical protein
VALCKDATHSGVFPFITFKLLPPPSPTKKTISGSGSGVFPTGGCQVRKAYIIAKFKKKEK